MKQIIGFATKFYTLWNYEAIPQYRTDNYGNHHQTGVQHKYYFIKNISTDIEKVKSLLPNVAIDMELKGTKSFICNEKIELPNNYFWGGKYVGILIDEIMEIDFKYCLWTAENYNVPYIKNHPKYIAHFEAIEQEKKSIIDNAQTLKIGDVVDLEFLTNGYNADEYYTECCADARFGKTEVKVICVGVKLVSGMYPYLMPMVNGKIQKTKGKTINVKVTDVFRTNVNGNIVEQIIKIA